MISEKIIKKRKFIFFPVLNFRLKKAFSDDPGQIES